MGGDLVAGGMPHEGHLLREIGRREKLNARLVVVGANDQRDGLKSVSDRFN